MNAMDLHNEICNAIAQIIPSEGIVFNAAFREEMEDIDHVIPSIPVIDDDNNCAHYEDLFVATKTDFRTIDSDTMRPYSDLDVFELLNIYEYLTDVYEPYIKKCKEQQEREAHAKRMEELKRTVSLSSRGMYSRLMRFCPSANSGMFFLARSCTNGITDKRDIPTSTRTMEQAMQMCSIWTVTTFWLSQAIIASLSM